MAGTATEGESGAGVASASGDQLVENGLSSPLCKGAIAGRLSAAAESDCRTSGFVGALAPTNNYALDVHIDTGAFGLSKGGLLSVVQDVFIAPVWGALEWVVHSLLVMLEWCYTLELLGGGGTSAVAGALAHARAGFTDPWLALALALASLLALYHGLVRRRVADTLGGALTMLAMMAGGLWVIADPSGTVGVVGQWADRASLGALAVAASGNPSSTAMTLGDSMRTLYAGAIEKPWCYMEFGNVGWCDDPTLLEPTLRAAAFALHEGAPAERARSAEQVRAATTNGALFLAFPANLPARNSIKAEGSLLRAICRSENATKCKGAAAAEAEFRTDNGTMPRLLGLLPIAVGVLGMALLFGLLALRLLAAAFLSLLLLLLAPLAVLAPALGDGGRALFTTWFTRLLGAVTSKLLFSFVLGALLTMQRMLFAFGSIGWWTQWLLVSAFWWVVFLKRHEAAAVMRGAAAHASRGRAPLDPNAGGSGPGLREGPLVRSLQNYGVIRHPKRWAQAQVNSRLPPAEPKRDDKGGGSQPAPAPSSGRARKGSTGPVGDLGGLGSGGGLGSKDGPSSGGGGPDDELGPGGGGPGGPGPGGDMELGNEGPLGRSASSTSDRASTISPDSEIPIDVHEQCVAKPEPRQAEGAEATGTVDLGLDGENNEAESGSDVGVQRPPDPDAHLGQQLASASDRTRTVERRTRTRSPEGRSTAAAASDNERRSDSAPDRSIPLAAGAAGATASAPSGAAAVPSGAGGGFTPLSPDRHDRGDSAGSPIMEDALAVAERRKRQLGFERHPFEGEP